MAIKPKRPCSQAGCRELTDSRYCPEHEQQYRKEKDERRGSAHERGYTKRWSRSSKRFLMLNPLCRHCENEGSIRASEVTDHIIPHKGDTVLFWDEENWQPLCKRHHDQKTVREDGGFGR
jgi:5-methylcytosine-specific restriction protein A